MFIVTPSTSLPRAPAAGHQCYQPVSAEEAVGAVKSLTRPTVGRPRPMNRAYQTPDSGSPAETARRQETPVPLLDRIRAFLTGPQGRRLTEQGRRYASDPRNQQRARDALARFRRR